MIMRFALDDQIVAQPGMVAQIPDRDVPRPDPDRPPVFTGIGTSPDAARGGRFVGMAVVANGAGEAGRQLAGAVHRMFHRWFARAGPWMRPFLSIVPLQRLTAELARLRGTDPDTPHGGAEPWRSVMTELEL